MSPTDHAHDHAHDADSESDGPPSTGFLPLSLAVGLFVTGLFALGIIPGFSCGPASTDSAAE